METKWTPGPWKAGRPDMATMVDGAPSKWIYAGEQYVACASGRIDGPFDKVMANAHLIAAAPDLYEALDWAIQSWDEHNKHGFNMQGDWVQDARAALAKARGEV